MSGPDRPALPVAIVGGLHADARRAAVARLLNDVPGSVVLHHDLATATAGTGYTYVTRKNRRNDPDRLTLRKYDPFAGRHVDFREER